MARRPSPGSAGSEPVTWRDGVHVTGTSIWCDARRARDVCFVSAWDRVARASHGQLIATRETLVQLGADAGAHLSVPYGRPFTLGAVRLELVPTGHALGAAALWIEHAGTRVLYAGAIASGRHVGLGAPAELRSCDALVVAAPYGAKEHVFPPAPETAAATVAWAARTAGEGRVAALLVTSAGKGLDVAAELAAAGLDVVAHRAIHHAAQRLRAAGIAPSALVRATDGGAAAGEATLALRRPGATVAPGRVVVWLVRDRVRLDAIAPAKTRATALVSGLAMEPTALADARADVGFAWSNAADRDQLLALVRGSGATSVFVTGRCAAVVAHAIGAGARTLGPPRQMGLFDEDAG
jgi:putative mRNA 3-end processing factor